MPPRGHSFLEIASSTTDRSAWYQIQVPKPCVLKPISTAHLVKYTNVPPSELTLTDGLHYTALDGICYMLRKGINQWYVNVPTDGTPATVKFVLLDAMSAVLAQAIATGATSSTSIGVTASAPTSVSVGAASASFLAAAANRYRVYVKNNETSSSKIVSFGIGAAAVSLDGPTIGPGDTLIFDLDDGCAAQIFAICASGSADVAVQVWSLS